MRVRSLIAAGVLLLMAGSCVVPGLSGALAGLAAKLPWMRPDLLPYGALALAILACPFLWRAWRLHRARQGRAELHVDHILIRWGDANLSLRPGDIEGYSTPHGEYVQLHVQDLPAFITISPPRGHGGDGGTGCPGCRGGGRL